MTKYYSVYEPYYSKVLELICTKCCTYYNVYSIIHFTLVFTIYYYSIVFFGEGGGGGGALLTSFPPNLSFCL